MALSVPVGIARSHTSNAEYAAPARVGFGLNRIGRVNVRPELVLPLRTGHPAPEAITARASRPDGTSDVGAIRVYEATEDVAESSAYVVVPANEAISPKKMQPRADLRHNILER
jgi:hypothetical protein